MKPSREQLLSLLATLGSKRAVGRVLLKDEKQIRRWCIEYSITDTKENSRVIIENLREEIGNLSYRKIRSKPIAEVKGETLVITLSDWHVGKEIRDEHNNIIFNESILVKRINDRLFPEILSLLDTRIKKSTKINDVVILCVGDMADGSDIFPTQIYQQYVAPPRQVMLCVELIIPFIESLVARGLPVTFYGVRGNHGKGLKLENPESNWDIMLYLILQYVVHQKKLKDVIVNFSDLEYMNLKIRGWNYHIRHIAPEQDDTSGGRVKFLGWKDMHKYDVIVYGHYHHFGITDIYGARRIRNGCVSGWDDLSEKMAKMADPVQVIHGCASKRAMSFIYPVDLKGE